MPTNLGNNDTEIYAEDTTLVVERIFDAPRELVWQAMTTPKHIARWYGRTGTTTTVVEMDVRPGGKWRLIAHTQDGKNEVPFAGEHLEVQQPEKVVRTFVFDVPPFNSGPPAVETLTLEDLGGKTKVLSSTRFPFAEALSGAVSSGLAEGSVEQYDRLADLLTELA